MPAAHGRRCPAARRRGVHARVRHRAELVGYNWYQGDYRSLIQINTDFPVRIAARDLGCHEGYPGHHVFNMLLERDLARGRNWVDSGSTRFFRRSRSSPRARPITASPAFPGEERLAFETAGALPAGRAAGRRRRGLFPAAGGAPRPGRRPLHHRPRFPRWPDRPRRGARPRSALPAHVPGAGRAIARLHRAAIGLM